METIIRQTTGEKVRKAINHRYAGKEITFEYSADSKEIEIYIAGYFLASVEVRDISQGIGFFIYLILYCQGGTMKNFTVTLTLGVTAKNEAEAKKEFWGSVDDTANDGFLNNNSLEAKAEE